MLINNLNCGFILIHANNLTLGRVDGARASLGAVEETGTVQKVIKASDGVISSTFASEGKMQGFSSYSEGEGLSNNSEILQKGALRFQDSFNLFFVQAIKKVTQASNQAISEYLGLERSEESLEDFKAYLILRNLSPQDIGALSGILLTAGWIICLTRDLFCWP